MKFAPRGTRSFVMSSSSTGAVCDDFSALLPPTWKSLVDRYLEDDLPGFDYGGFVVGDKPETAVLLGKSCGVLAGVPFFAGALLLLILIDESPLIC